MVQATQITEAPAVNIRRTGFQTGMQCEELAEKLARILGPNDPTMKQLASMGKLFKAGAYDRNIQHTLDSDPKGFLDDDLDLIWVSAGSVAAQGANGEVGWCNVDRANFAKFPDGVVTLDPDGKVVKPEGWQEPDHSNAIHPDLRPKPLLHFPV